LGSGLLRRYQLFLTVWKTIEDIQLWCCRWYLALTLFVAWVVADDHDATVATNNLALVADLLDAWVNLHVSYFSSGLFSKPIYL
jgi:hypothetical protein